MLKLDASRLPEGESDGWDAFVERSNEGTIFHRLDFLAYHGDRFLDSVHHLVVRKSSEWFAVVPLAILVEDGRRVARSPSAPAWEAHAVRSGCATTRPMR